VGDILLDFGRESGIEPAVRFCHFKGGSCMGHGTSGVALGLEALVVAPMSVYLVREPIEKLTTGRFGLRPALRAYQVIGVVAQCVQITCVLDEGCLPGR